MLRRLPHKFPKVQYFHSEDVFGSLATGLCACLPEMSLKRKVTRLLISTNSCPATKNGGVFELEAIYSLEYRFCSIKANIILFILYVTDRYIFNGCRYISDYFLPIYISWPSTGVCNSVSHTRHRKRSTSMVSPEASNILGR